MFPLQLVIFAVGDWSKALAWGSTKEKVEHDKVNDLKDNLKERFDEILQTINSRDSPLEEFDEEIFNTLVEKIEILIPTYFVFELKSGLMVEQKLWLRQMLLLPNFASSFSPSLIKIMFNTPPEVSFLYVYSELGPLTFPGVYKLINSAIFLEKKPLHFMSIGE